MGFLKKGLRIFLLLIMQCVIRRLMRCLLVLLLFFQVLSAQTVRVSFFIENEAIQFDYLVEEIEVNSHLVLNVSLLQADQAQPLASKLKKITISYKNEFSADENALDLQALMHLLLECESLRVHVKPPFKKQDYPALSYESESNDEEDKATIELDSFTLNVFPSHVYIEKDQRTIRLSKLIENIKNESKSADVLLQTFFKERTLIEKLVSQKEFLKAKFKFLELSNQIEHKIESCLSVYGCVRELDELKNVYQNVLVELRTFEEVFKDSIPITFDQEPQKTLGYISFQFGIDNGETSLLQSKYAIEGVDSNRFQTSFHCAYPRLIHSQMVSPVLFSEAWVYIKLTKTSDVNKLCIIFPNTFYAKAFEEGLKWYLKNVSQALTFKPKYNIDVTAIKKGGLAQKRKNNKDPNVIDLSKIKKNVSTYVLQRSTIFVDDANQTMIFRPDFTYEVHDDSPFAHTYKEIKKVADDLTRLQAQILNISDARQMLSPLVLKDRQAVFDDIMSDSLFCDKKHWSYDLARITVLNKIKEIFKRYKLSFDQAFTE